MPLNLLVINFRQPAKRVRTLYLSVLTSLSLALTPALNAATDHTAAQNERLAPLAFLAGHCWEGVFDTGYRDIQCYEWLYRKQFLRSEHKVIGTQPQYEGITFYGWDSARERMRFHYFTNAGAVSEGHLEPVENGFRVPEMHVDAQGNQTEIETLFTQIDDYHYSAASRRLVDGQWKELHSAKYRRSDAPELQ